MIHTLERFLEWGGVKKAVTYLVFSGIALLVSIFDLLPQLPLTPPGQLSSSAVSPSSWSSHRPGDSL